MESKSKKPKTGGRKKGTPNKRTLLLEDNLEQTGINPVQGLKDCLDDLMEIMPTDPGDIITIIRARASIFLDLMNYLYPKRKTMDYVIPNPTEGMSLKEKLDYLEKATIIIRKQIQDGTEST